MSSLRNLALPAGIIGAIVLAMACGGEASGTGPLLDAEVASVRILPPPVDHNLHLGDTYQLRADVLNANGNRLDRDVTWFIYPASPYPPPLASVSANGRLTIESPMIFSLDVEAVAGAVSDQERMIFRGWGFEEGFFPGTHDIYARAHLSGNVGSEGPPRLHIRCEREKLSLFVGAPFAFGTELVRYRIGRDEERIEQWTDSSELQALVYPEDPGPLVAALSLADTLTVTIERTLGEVEMVLFVPTGLERFVDALVPPCGSNELRSR